MRTSLSSIAAALLLILGYGLEVQAYSPDAESVAIDKVTSASEAAALTIKGSYTTTRTFVLDYEAGEKKLQASLAKICADFKNEVCNSPVQHLGNITLLQYEEQLRQKQAECDSQIEGFIRHSNLDQRVARELPNFQRKAQLNAQSYTGGMMDKNPLARSIAQQLTDPRNIAEQTQKSVIDSDNEKASEYQGLRNKIQREIDKVTEGRDLVEDKIRELKAIGIENYTSRVGRRVAAMSGPSVVRTSATSLLNKEQARSTMKLKEIKAGILARVQRKNAEAAIVQSSVSNRNVSVTSSGGAIAPQFIPGPDGIGGRTIPGLVSPAPPVVYPQQMQGYALNAPSIPTAAPMRLPPMQLNFGSNNR